MKLGIISDIHGNHYALEKVLKDAKKNHIEKLLVLGDIVGYYYHPDTVMEMLEEWDHELIKGNHEKLMEGLQSGNIKMEVLREKYGHGHQVAIEKLSGKQIQQLITAPEKKKVVVNDVSILMCHGTNWNADFYLYPDAKKEILDKCNQKDVDFVVVGHSHYSFIYRNANSTLINAGSVGQSRSMGGVANWAIINTKNKCFELRSTAYDISPLLEEIEQTDPGLPYLRDVLKRNN